MSNELKDFPVIIKLPVLWGHMDAFQHLNNVVFFRFFESVRIAYFEEIGFLEVMKSTGIGPILASTSCKYIKPITYPDTVSVGARVTNIEEDRFGMEYTMLSQEKEEITATGTALVVSYDYNKNKKANIPDEIRDKILNLERKVL
jgi:acyl-CoA thioester hydrolase